MGRDVETRFVTERASDERRRRLAELLAIGVERLLAAKRPPHDEGLWPVDLSPDLSVTTDCQSAEGDCA